MGKLYDTHFHLDLQKSLPDALSEIEVNETYTIAVTNLPPLYEKLKNSINSKYVRVALGFHPELVAQYQKYIPEMWRLLPDAKYIGEVGIDLKTSKSSRDIQISFFEELIHRSSQMGGKIMSIHSRMAAAEVVSIIGEKYNGKIILHWFSGTKQIQLKAIEKGCYFSVNNAMLNSESGRKVIEIIPSDKILIETDSPFVSAEGFLNRQVAQIQKSIELLSFLKKLDSNKLQQMLWNNFLSLISM